MSKNLFVLVGILLCSLALGKTDPTNRFIQLPSEIDIDEAEFFDQDGKYDMSAMAEARRISQTQAFWAGREEQEDKEIATAKSRATRRNEELENAKSQVGTP